MRIIALLVLLIPGILAVFGIKIMRDSLFAEYYPIFFNPGLQFFAGLILFVGGTFLSAGLSSIGTGKINIKLFLNNLRIQEKMGRPHLFFIFPYNYLLIMI